MAGRVAAANELITLLQAIVQESKTDIFEDDHATMEPINDKATKALEIATKLFQDLSDANLIVNMLINHFDGVSVDGFNIYDRNQQNISMINNLNRIHARAFAYVNDRVYLPGRDDV